MQFRCSVATRHKPTLREPNLDPNPLKLIHKQQLTVKTLQIENVLNFVTNKFKVSELYKFYVGFRGPLD